MILESRLEARRPFAVRKPLRAQSTNGDSRAVTVPATDGVTIFADPEHRAEYGQVRFTWGPHLLVTELSMFREATEDLLGIAERRLKRNTDSAPHAAETMVISRLMDGRWRANCSACGGIASLSAAQGETGTATCFGDEILVARTPVCT
jgi:hypothetical protein